MQDDATPEQTGKRKLSRKEQLKELTRLKKSRAEVRADPEFVPPPVAPDDRDMEECDELTVEQPGDAARRQREAYNSRRSRGRSQPDFRSECSALQHVVEKRITFRDVCCTASELCPGGTTDLTCMRHCCLFLPKFHCELNWIERVWGASKAYTRSHCMYSLQGLRETVPISLSQDISDLPLHLQGRADLPVCPLYAQRRWARISRQYMHEYRKGANACDAIRNVTAQRTQKRHRDTNDSRSRQVEARMASLSRGM